MSDSERIVGVWRLVSVVYEDAETKSRAPVYGERPRGWQIATKAGRWLALMTGDGRAAPASEAERAKAFTSMIAYSGRYRVTDGKVVTKVEAAWNESWVGGEQTRFIRFERDGNLLLIESPEMPHPNLEGRRVRVIVTWEREE